ncbi:MAG: inositol monophosphatase family protein [Parvibaculales bacterium]
MSPRSATLNVIMSAIDKAARGLRRDFGEIENLQVSRKGPGDFVTNADLRAEAILKEELMQARPGYGLLMEESGLTEGGDKSHRWIVDPLDGTTNFLHGIPHFAISVALEREGKLVAGVVYNPATDDLFYAEHGQGAYMNNKRIRVSGRDSMADSVFACGIPHGQRQGRPAFVKEIDTLLPKVSGLRRMGAASLDLAYVAAGRMDGFWERGLQAWDMAAGIVLVKEAGGRVSDINDKQDMLETGGIIAANETLHAKLYKELSKD